MYENNSASTGYANANVLKDNNGVRKVVQDAQSAANDSVVIANELLGRIRGTLPGTACEKAQPFADCLQGDVGRLRQAVQEIAAMLREISEGIG